MFRRFVREFKKIGGNEHRRIDWIYAGYVNHMMAETKKILEHRTCNHRRTGGDFDSDFHSTAGEGKGSY